MGGWRAGRAVVNIMHISCIIVDQPIAGVTGISFNKCTTLAEVLAVIANASGGPGPQGPAGPTGPAGADGADGATGLSVTAATLVNVAGVSHLHFTLSDGSTLDAGAVTCCPTTTRLVPGTPGARRCYAYGYGVWGSAVGKWLSNSAFTDEVPTPFFPASLTLVGGYLQLVGQAAQPLTLPTPASLTLSGAAQLVDKFVGIGLGLVALDQLVNSIPEFAANGITFHAGRSPFWALDYNTTVVEDLGLVFRDSSNGGARSTDYLLRVGVAGYGDGFFPPMTQAEAEDPTHSNYDLANLYQSETVCINL